MRHGSLFSGIGGFDLAAEWMGWENRFHCECNEFGRRVLNYYWPGAESFHDITKTDFKKYANRIDVLTGGFPCQPYSTAGKRLGKADDRHLWPEMLRAIREIQPRFVVAENVSGLVSWNGGMVFHEVQSDLEAEGYEVVPFLIPACGINAPHKRERIWFVAHRESDRDRRNPGAMAEKTPKPKCEDDGTEFNNCGKNGLTQNPHSDGWNGEQRQGQPGQRGQRDASTGDHEQLPTDNGADCDPKFSGLERGIGAQLRHKPGSNGTKGIAANTKTSGIQGDGADRQQEPSAQAGQGILGCDNPGDYWTEWPTESPLRGKYDGVSPGLDGITVSKHRQESIKAYGNAIVPQVAFEIFKAIEKYEGIKDTGKGKANIGR